MLAPEHRSGSAVRVPVRPPQLVNATPFDMILLVSEVSASTLAGTADDGETETELETETEAGRGDTDADAWRRPTSTWPRRGTTARLRTTRGGMNDASGISRPQSNDSAHQRGRCQAS